MRERDRRDARQSSAAALQRIARRSQPLRAGAGDATLTILIQLPVVDERDRRPLQACGRRSCRRQGRRSLGFSSTRSRGVGRCRRKTMHTSASSPHIRPRRCRCAGVQGQRAVTVRREPAGAAKRRRRTRGVAMAGASKDAPDTAQSPSASSMVAGGWAAVVGGEGQWVASYVVMTVDRATVTQTMKTAHKRSEHWGALGLRRHRKRMISWSGPAPIGTAALARSACPPGRGGRRGPKRCTTTSRGKAPLAEEAVTSTGSRGRQRVESAREQGIEGVIAAVHRAAKPLVETDLPGCRPAPAVATGDDPGPTETAAGSSRRGRT